MIIIDYNGIAIGSIASQKLDPDENLIRHTILNQIRLYRSRFIKEYGEVVIVADGGENWRKVVFPQYKAKRKATRDDKKEYWDEVFRITSMILRELIDNFPYKVMHIWGCEADDVIAQLAYNTQEFGNYEPVMIVSADHDFKQLQKFDNIKQYSPLTKKFVEEENPLLYLQEHILKGDAGDGVPNVLSDDNVFVEGRRQSSLSAKKKQTLLQDPEAMGADIYRNYQRNKMLVNLNSCPDPIKKDIINKFESQDQGGNRGKVFPYLVEKKCTLLLEVVEEFI